jgi:hypothetical protein
MMKQIGILLNPNSRKNKRNPQRRERLQEILGQRGSLVATRSLSEVRCVLEDFLAQDIKYFLADGGDGTFFWMVNTLRQIYREREQREYLPFCLPTNSGTMNCVNRKVQVLGSGEQIVRRLLKALEEPSALKNYSVPTLKLTGENLQGEPFEQLCFAVALAGVGPNFFSIYDKIPNRGPKDMVWIVLKAIFSACLQLPVLRTLPLSLHSYIHQLTKPAKAKVWMGNEVLPSEEFRFINASAFDLNFVHIFRMFPLAKEGKFHFQAGNPSLFRLILHLPHLVSGSLLRGQNMWEKAGLEMECVSEEPEGFSAILDGELWPHIRRLKISPGLTIPVPLC